MADYTFPVEATHILMFARGIGDPSPAYSDPDSDEAEAAGGIVAPPTFAMAGAQFDPEHHLRPKVGEPWFGSGREPTGEQREPSGVLHAEQHFEYHQPMRPGMQLEVTTRPGEEWDKESKRAGKLHFFEKINEYRDAATGELVVTMRMVSVRTERAVDSDQAKEA